MYFFQNKEQETHVPSRRETIENFKRTVNEEIEKQVAENVQVFSKPLRDKGYTDEEIDKEIVQLKEEMRNEAIEMFKEQLINPAQEKSFLPEKKG
jgi:hypothetical protein